MVAPQATAPQMHITLRQLKYFVEIAHSRSFSRAAQHLSIAQPALSQSMLALESDLDTVLLLRHARGVDLTPAGELLLEQAVALLARTHALKDLVQGRAPGPSGSVRLAIAGSLAGVLAGPLARAIAHDFPGIDLAVKDGMSLEVRAQIESRAVHLAVMPSPAELQGMESLALLKERFFLFGAAQAMRTLPAQIPFDQVAALPLAQPDRAHDLRKIIERTASARGLRLDVRHEVNSTALLVSLVREGLAYAVMPASACPDALACGALQGRPVVQPRLERVQAAVWPGDRPLGPAATAVRDTLAKVVRQLVRQGRLLGNAAGATHQKK